MEILDLEKYDLQRMYKIYDEWPEIARNTWESDLEIIHFDSIHLRQNLFNAAKIIQLDKKHLDNNPVNITTENIIDLLELINSEKVFR